MKKITLAGVLVVILLVTAFAVNAQQNKDNVKVDGDYSVSIKNPPPPGIDNCQIYYVCSVCNLSADGFPVPADSSFILVPSTHSHDGYAFSCFQKENRQYSIGDSFLSTGPNTSITFTAVFELTGFAVTFNCNVCSDSYGVDLFDEGKTLSFTKAKHMHWGHAFKEYYSPGLGSFTTSMPVVTSDLVVTVVMTNTAPNYKGQVTFDTNFSGVSVVGNLYENEGGDDPYDLLVRIFYVPQGFEKTDFTCYDNSTTGYPISYVKEGALFLKHSYDGLYHDGTCVNLRQTEDYLVTLACSLCSDKISHSLKVNAAIPEVTPHVHSHYVFSNYTDGSGNVFTPQNIPVATSSVVYTAQYIKDFDFIVTITDPLVFHSDEVDGIEWTTWLSYCKLGTTFDPNPYPDCPDTMRFIGWQYEGVIYEPADMPALTKDCEIFACFSNVNLNITFEYVNADGYFVTERIVFNQFDDTLTIPPAVTANPNFLEFPRFNEHPHSNMTYTAIYKTKDLTIQSPLGDDVILKVEYITFKEALKKFNIENKTYFAFFFGVGADSGAVDEYIDKEIAVNPSAEWQKYNYYFYYNLRSYMYDKPILDVDLSNPTYHFHVTHTLKQFYPSFDSATSFYSGYTAEGLTQEGADWYRADTLHIVTDFTKPVIFNVEKLVFLKVINAENGLTYKIPFNRLKIIDGKACLKIDLSNPFVLRDEFFGDIDPYTIIGALAYDITVTGSYSYKIVDKTLCIYLVPDLKAEEYVVNVYFAKIKNPIADELLPDVVKDAMKFITDLANSIGNFFSSVFNFIGNMDIKLIIIIAIIIFVLLVTAPLWVPLIPFLFKLLLKLITLPVRLIVMLVKKIAKK